MKILFFLLLLQFSAFGQESHSGHEHDPGENCEVTGKPSPTLEELASQALAAMSKLSPDQRYCEGIKKCGGYAHYDAKFSGDCKFDVKATCGLEAREVSAIKFYTGSGYSCLNQYLWGKDRNEKQAVVETLNSALNKLPEYQGFVARGTDLPASIRATHELGATVTYEAFTSTSSISGWQGTDRFLIYSLTGRPIMSLSSLPHENEVLFKSGTKFRIISVKGNSYRHYVMREVVGEESEKKAKAEDERILALAQQEVEKSRAPASTGDSSDRLAGANWNCPVGNEKIPRVFERSGMPTSSADFLPSSESP